MRKPTTISGLTPSTTYYIRAFATNIIGTGYSEELDFHTPLYDIPTLTTAAVTDIINSSAVGGGKIIADGGDLLIAEGICWSTSNYPTVLDAHTSDNARSGTFTHVMTGLTPATSYNVRAYLITAHDTVHGAQKTFTTHSIPSATTLSVSYITTSSARVIARVTNNGGTPLTVRGICWSTSPNPTVADNITSNGQSSGSYSTTINNLEPSTTYYVRAYATNQYGTGYGEELIFTTP